MAAPISNTAMILLSVVGSYEPQASGTAYTGIRWGISLPITRRAGNSREGDMNFQLRAEVAPTQVQTEGEEEEENDNAKEVAPATRAEERHVLRVTQDEWSPSILIVTRRTVNTIRQKREKKPDISLQ
ncbi:hypothetical protein K440DRAFT_644219 [Wilcoxina mikolae CBS 423.85]|nr:hypothetical protein K440DRAFT_644219 [Wilcoxina mikolae CBS 423.85]